MNAWIGWTAAAVLAVCLAGAAATPAGAGPVPRRGPLDPRGRIHIPIGIANSLDSLKTFVEAEGGFSPGVGTYGISFWVFDPETEKLTAPTMDGVATEHGLAPGGHLIPWTTWQAGPVRVRTEVCEVRRASPEGDVFVVAARAALTNTSDKECRVVLYAVLRPVGPAGGDVKQMAVGQAGDALLVDGRAALVAGEKPTMAGVFAQNLDEQAIAESTPPPQDSAESAEGNCSGAMAFDVAIPRGQTRTVGFICPVLPGRRAVAHRWDGTSPWAQLDLAKPDPAEGGTLQPDPGLAYWRDLRADAIFDEARAYWQDLVGRTRVRVPDGRWAECLAAIAGHGVMSMNSGAPDVAVVNYNAFNRDGVYVANILQKAGRADLAAEAIDYFLAHPFNGRVAVEADNPGQVLWILGEHWKFTRDRAWLERVYPSARKLAALVRYCRTTPGPHLVKADSLDFGDALPPDRPDDPPALRRQELKPGSCDGNHPEYTEAFDVAGLRAAAALAAAAGREDDARTWDGLARSLFAKYDAAFGERLAQDYGSYAVLWPCRLYPLGEGKAHERFRGVGKQEPARWRYFPLATAHQGLLAGNREAGCATLAAHLAHEQMRGWYAFDEGGDSGPGGWGHVRTTWKPGVAMPHGWAIAEMWLLMRDALLFEDEDRLVLLAGVPPEWFTAAEGMAVEGMPTWFGPCTFRYEAAAGKATLNLAEAAAPPGGYVLRLPPELEASVEADGRAVARSASGEVALPAGTKQVRIAFGARK